MKGEFWLGLDKIKRLTHQARNRLRVDLEDTKGKSAYAEYDFFAVSSERSKYKLSLGTYSGKTIVDIYHIKLTNSDFRINAELSRNRTFIKYLKDN